MALSAHLPSGILPSFGGSVCPPSFWAPGFLQECKESLGGINRERGPFRAAKVLSKQEPGSWVSGEAGTPWLAQAGLRGADGEGSSPSWRTMHSFTLQLNKNSVILYQEPSSVAGTYLLI